jgi:hypothetical protein
VCSRTLQHGLALLIFIIIDSVDPITAFIEFIEAELILNVGRQGKKNSNANGQPNNIDKGEKFITKKISEGSVPIVLKHWSGDCSLQDSGNELNIAVIMYLQVLAITVRGLLE